MAATAVEIQGECAPAFEAVRAAFATNFAEHDELGAAVAVYAGGRKVVDLWGGHADAARTRPWERDTIVNVWSTTKGMTATCAHRLVQRGLLNVDAPVAGYWPEFSAAGKERLPVRFLLTHQAGLASVEQELPPEATYDWETMTAALAAQAPSWIPGTRFAYHAMTFGWLVGEVVRRISGKSLGAFFRDELATPLGIDFHIGLAPEHDHRVAEVVPAQRPEGAPAPSDPAAAERRRRVNSVEWRRAELPAANGHGNARGVARVYGALATGGAIDGVQVLQPETIRRASAEVCAGEQAGSGRFNRFALGYQLNLMGPERPFGPNPRAFGHHGAGGSEGFADPEAGLGFGYTMNRMAAGEDLRAHNLVEAVYASL